jgi:hypothetical protein
MSYQWLDDKGNVVLDGTRSAVVPALQPGESRSLRLISFMPRRPATLHLSPVQEACTWALSRDPGHRRNDSAVDGG